MRRKYKFLSAPISQRLISIVSAQDLSAGRHLSMGTLSIPSRRSGTWLDLSKSPRAIGALLTTKKSAGSNLPSTAWEKQLIANRLQEKKAQDFSREQSLFLDSETEELGYIGRSCTVTFVMGEQDGARSPS